MFYSSQIHIILITILQIDPSSCHYLIDFDYPDQGEPHYPGAPVGTKKEKRDEGGATGVWETVFTQKFLVHGRSAALARAFWVPIFADKYLDSFLTYFISFLCYLTS
jgi:hypothetical protein